MKPIKQIGNNVKANVNYTGPDMFDLPVYYDEPSNTCISCWKLTWKERLQVLFFGKLWLGIMGKQPPVWLETDEENVFDSFQSN